MKKLEYILYALTLIVALIVIMAKTLLWSWAGTFLIISYQTLAFIFMVISWLIYSTKNEEQKRLYFLYGTIPIGLSIGLLLLSSVAKLQHWSWHTGAFRMTIFMFVITEVIFITAYVLTKMIGKKDFIKQMMLKVFIFIAIAFTVMCVDFDKLISAISSKEANEQRELWKIESQKADSLYQHNENN